MNVVEIETAPDGYEVEEVSDAKDLVMDVVQDALEFWGVDTSSFASDFDAISTADLIVEKLIAAGWRPTEAAEAETNA